MTNKHTAVEVKQELKKIANPKKAKNLQRFFKTGSGEYGEGDVFLGLTVPEQRKIAKKFGDLSLTELQKLITSDIHEHRLVCLLILRAQYEKGSYAKQDKIVKFYLKNKHHVNNWDLVDLSAPYILGNYLINKKAQSLYDMAKSKSLWDRRIAVVATAAFIKQSQFKETLKLAQMLLSDDHDLIHKAVGWMLREVGKKDEATLIKFLDKHTKQMPRTMLRYSLEKLSDKKRKYYMKL